MVNQLRRFKQWVLNNQRYFRVAWFTKESQPSRPQPSKENLSARTPGMSVELSNESPSEVPSELPSELFQQITDATEQLPIHPSEQSVVIEAIKNAIEQCRAQGVSGSVVILGHPVTSVAKILTDSLGKLKAHQVKVHQANAIKVTRLDWAEQPAEPAEIKHKLQEKLDPSHQATNKRQAEPPPSELGTPPTDCQTTLSGKIKSSKSLKSLKSLIVIPNLGGCFLRSADGLAGIDYLQEKLLEDSWQVSNQQQTRLWVIGSNQVGWEYLTSTVSFQAYCGDIFRLSTLTGKQLKDWLSPIVEQFDIEFSDADLRQRIKQAYTFSEKSRKSDQIELDKRPTEILSRGLSETSQEILTTISASLRAVKDSLSAKETAEAEDSPQQAYFERLADISDGISIVALQIFIQSLKFQDGVIAHAPKLPVLPELSQPDLYLLYVLMIHGDLTVRSLASSLGDHPRLVNSQVQLLCNANVIQQQGRVVKLNPIHYPRLRRELERNNFVIEVP